MNSVVTTTPKPPVLANTPTVQAMCLLPLSWQAQICQHRPDDEHSSIDITLIHKLKHKSRWQCQQWVKKQRLPSIEFAHWLALPSLNVLLVFRQQRCTYIAANMVFGMHTA